MFLETCMQIHSVVFALSRHINKKKDAKTSNLLYAGNKDFVKYQAQGEEINPNPPCLRPCVVVFVCSVRRTGHRFLGRY